MTHDQQPSFGELLRRHRVAAELTQEDLAERAHLSARAISDLERGLKRRPRRDTVQLLADALGLPAEDRDALETSLHRATARTPERRRPTNLPQPPTALLGRAGELAHLCHVLRHENARLVTLTGPGGVGKTRLALEVGAALLNEFDDGVLSLLVRKSPKTPV